MFTRDCVHEIPKHMFAVGKIGASYSPNNSGVEFSVSKQFGYVQGLGVQFSKPTFGISFNTTW